MPDYALKKVVHVEITKQALHQKLAASINNDLGTSIDPADIEKIEYDTDSSQYRITKFEEAGD
jgi:hypothetical protein